MSDNNDKLAKFPFEGHELTFYNFKGRQCVIATNFDVTLRYATDGKGLKKSITDPEKWGSEFKEGTDYDILEGQNLRDFRGGCVETDPIRVRLPPTARRAA